MSEPEVLPCSIRKLPSYVQHHTYRDDNTNTSSKEAPAPTNKSPVSQGSASSAGRRKEETTHYLFGSEFIIGSYLYDAEAK